MSKSEQSKQVDDGGPAFPITDQVASGGEGMTLLDYFAAKALQGIMTQCQQDEAGANNGWGNETLDRLNCKKDGLAHTVARFSYAIARAMLAAKREAEKAVHP